MTSELFNEDEAVVEENIDSENSECGNGNVSSKLERRRRIEDLYEERRLREELSEY